MLVQPGRKINRLTSLQRTQLIKWLLEYDKEKLRRRSVVQLTVEASETFKCPYNRVSVSQIARDLGLEISCRKTRSSRGVKERSGLGNARKIMFLARIVRELFYELGKPNSEMLSLLCSGNAFPDEVAANEKSS